MIGSNPTTHNNSRYFCFYSNCNNNDSKLIFAELKKFKKIFTKKSDVELNSTYTRIHTDYNSMEVSSKLEVPYFDNRNNIKNEFKETIKIQLDEFIKTKSLDNYIISYLSFDKYNLKMKMLLSTHSKCIKEGDLIFNNEKLHKILIKLKDKNITNKSSFMNTLFNENECNYVYNFLKFYYKVVDVDIMYDYNTDIQGKTPEEITQINISNNKKLDSLNHKMICDNINKHFAIYMEKIKLNKLNNEFKITKQDYYEISIRGTSKYFYIVNNSATNSNQEHNSSGHTTTRVRNRHDFVKHIYISENIVYFKTDYTFLNSNIKNIDYIKKLFENYINKSTYNNGFNKNILDNETTTIYNKNINNYNLTKPIFINNNILSKNHSNKILQIKEDYDLCYIQTSNILIYISKFDYYIDNKILNKLLYNDIFIEQKWFVYFFNNYFNFVYHRLTLSKFYNPAINNLDSNKPLCIINNVILEEISKNISNKQLDQSILDEQPNSTEVLKNFTLEPFDYQKQNTYWMKSIENNIISNNNNIPYISNPNYYLINNNANNIDFCYILNNKHNGKIYKYNNDFIKKYSKNIKLCGGILTDEVGLGKTLSCITHIMSCFLNDISDDYINKMNYNANNLIIVPNRLVAQWYTEIKKYLNPSLFKKVNVIKITTITDIKKKLYNINYNKYGIYIISSNLVNNINYFKYLTTDCYNIIEFLKKIKKLSEDDKKEYHSLIKSTTKKYVDFVKLDNKELLEELNEYKLNNKKKFNIFKIKWNRIILDEAHEVLKTHPTYNTKNTYIINDNINRRYTTNNEFNEGVDKKDRLKYSLLCKLKTNYKWCLTATPFKNKLNNLYCYINFLNNDYTQNITKSESEINEMDNEILLKYLETTEEENPKKNGIICNGVENALYGINNSNLINIFTNNIRCNTKSDIKGVVDIPIFTEDITYLTQNSIERNIYIDALRVNNRVRLFQLCTHLLVSEGIITDTNFGTTILNLNEIQKIMVNKYKKEIIKCESDISTNIYQNEKVNEKEELYKTLVLSLDKFEFNNNSSEHYIEPHFKNQINTFINISVRSNRYYYNKYHSIEMLTRINSIIFEINNVKKYIIDLNLLKEDILEIMDFPREYTLLKYKYYIIYKIILNESHNCETTIKDNNDNISKRKREIIRLGNQIKLFETNDFLTESIKDPCSICFMEYESEIAITKCRHIMCGDCIKMLFSTNTNASCPFCRTHIHKKDINFTHYDKLQLENNSNENDVETNSSSPCNKKETLIENDKIINKEENILKYGTKLAHMLHYLSEIFTDKDNRVIIFSQYDNMLTLIGKVLDDFKIKNLFIKGNITSVSKKIDKFKTDPSYRVIMLSSERCSSGSNLTEATHIILADVVNGDAAYTKDIESQAIGRAVRIGQKKPVVVKRFIMQNTIEQEYYNKNKYNMTDLQL